MDRAIPLERQIKKKRFSHVITKNMGVIFSYVFLISMSVIILYPILVTLMSAFNVSNSLYSTSFFPENFSLTENFVHLFNDTPYLIISHNKVSASVAQKCFESLNTITYDVENLIFHCFYSKLYVVVD